MTKFTIQTNTGLSDRAIVAIGDRFDVVLIRTADGLKIEVYPITGGEAWDDPFERFKIDESEIRKLEEEMAKTEATATCPLLVPSGTPLMEGKLYLQLHHGRNHPDEEMQDWGFRGPTFGPLACHAQTYLIDLWMHGANGEELRLRHHDDLIVWNNAYFGSMAIFIATGKEHG